MLDVISMEKARVAAKAISRDVTKAAWCVHGNFTKGCHDPDRRNL
jgi:hypothetical protein